MSVVAPSPPLRDAPWGALAVSLVVHLTILGISSAIVFSPRPAKTSVVEIDATISEPLVEEPEPLLLTEGEWQPVPAGGSPNPVAVAIDNPAADQGSSLSGLIGVTGGGTGTDQVATDKVGLGGTGGGTGDGDGTGSGSGRGFFGLETKVKRTVFVVDASRSMNYPYPGEAKNRLGRVKIELYRTISKMSAEQSFFVIFFNIAPIPMPSRGMVRADPLVIRPYMEWIFAVRGMDKTDPQAALLMALQLNPDQIYFLTDGDFSYRCVRSAREANRNRIPIHTIGFGGKEGEKNLQEIARDSQGTYQFIPEPVDIQAVNADDKPLPLSKSKMP
ncbi:MAG: hypothetical protein U0929_02770 [Planctomycetaceae bacterium]